MKPPRHRWYFPGIISLACLFPLCYFYIVQRGFLTPDYFIKIIVLEESMEKGWLTACGWYGNRQNIYTVRDFTLTGNDTEDGLTLHQLDSFANKLSVARDTFNRALIHFSPKMPYKTFIRTIDLCRKNKVQHYYNKKSFLMWYVQPRDTTPLNMIKVYPCGTTQIMAEEMRKNTVAAKLEERRKTHFAIAKDLVISWLILLATLFLYRKLSTITS